MHDHAWCGGGVPPSLGAWCGGGVPPSLGAWCGGGVPPSLGAWGGDVRPEIQRQIAAAIAAVAAFCLPETLISFCFH